MSTQKSEATIEFPASAIDSEVRECLKNEGVQFKPQIFGPSLEIDSLVNDLEAEIDSDGIFRLYNPYAEYGEFADLEAVFIKKNIAFDRESKADWHRPALLRIFRPGDKALDLLIPQDPDFCDLKAKIREIIRSVEDKDISEMQALEVIEKYLNHKSPPYPPLSDYEKMEARPWFNIEPTMPEPFFRQDSSNESLVCG